MGTLSRAVTAAPLFILTTFISAPAFGQLDLSGSWQPQYQEDQPERIPGPDLVDYLGIPINDAARQWALFTGSRNGRGTDEYARWCAADREAVALYEDCVAAVEAAAKGTRYEGADPEYL